MLINNCAIFRADVNLLQPHSLQFISMDNVTCHSLRLPYLFDAGRLRNDLQICLEQQWKEHFNTKDYSGHWTSIALHSPSGNEHDILTHGENFSPTSLLTQCLYFGFVLDHFRCDKESVRLLNLAPGSVVHEHRDRGLGYEHGVFRIHVPLQTNTMVDFIVAGTRLEMNEGECWYANFDLPHSVNNRSEENRIHLVIDCIRNEWTDELFATAGYDFEVEKKMRQPDQRTTLAMIAELERMNTDTARAMITDLKRGLNA